MVLVEATRKTGSHHIEYYLLGSGKWKVNRRYKCKYSNRCSEFRVTVEFSFKKFVVSQRRRQQQRFSQNLQPTTMAASSDAPPKEAIIKIVPIVDALAEDVIFGDGDLETAMVSEIHVW